MNSAGERVMAPGVEITLEELQRRLGDGSLAIVNVLPLPAFEESRIPGSISLPLAEIATRADKVLPDRTREIVVYCANPT
jgi:rhodanese-related sulfurtransferase